MDFSNIENLIEAEVTKRVNEKLAVVNANKHIDFYTDQIEMLNKLEQSFRDIIEDYRKNIREKISYYNTEETNPDVERKNMKCDFPNCYHYGTGDVDSVCEKCDSHIIKNEQKENKPEPSTIKKSPNINEENETNDIAELDRILNKMLHKYM